MDRLEATFRGTIADLRHKRPETAGTVPGTKLTVDTEALDPELAVKLFRMENGQPVQITITEIQDRMPLEENEPDPEPGVEIDGEGNVVPAAFRESFPDDPRQPA